MKHLATLVIPAIALAITAACAGPSEHETAGQKIENPSNTEKAAALLESFNTGDTAPIAFINPDKYIQHNLAVADGLEGLGAFVNSAPPKGFSAKIHRIFADGDYVVAHTEYDVFGPKAGFDIFRFENGLIVEHWDNLSEITQPNPSGRTQFDGATKIEDQGKTEANKALVSRFVDDILVDGKVDKLGDYISADQYLQHNSTIADGMDGLAAAFEYLAANDMVLIYDQKHLVLGQGNFVLVVSEGKFGKVPGLHTAFYDLFRVEDGKIVEHWDILETIPPQSEWKNNNGKF